MAVLAKLLAGPNIRAVLMNVNPSERRGTVFSAFTLCDDLGKGLGPSIAAWPHQLNFAA